MSVCQAAYTGSTNKQTLPKFCKERVKCHFSPCDLGHFGTLVQRFHFSSVGPKRFHRCHFSPLG
ncbi:hypothetical protein Hanom_Chr08g00711831 [Helianthus anomalus]